MTILEDVAEFEEMEFPEFPYTEVTSTILMVESASAFEDFIAEGGPQNLSAPGYHGRGPTRGQPSWLPTMSRPSGSGE